MYYKIKCNETVEDHWDIMDRDDSYICTVIGEEWADYLLTHLNR